MFLFFFFKQKTAYEMRISDWSSDVCSSDLAYTHVNDRFAPFASRTIPATVSEAPYLLDGLTMNEAGRRIEEQYADTGGFTDHLFGISAMLGYRLVLRIRDLPRSEEHTSELQSLMRISYAVFCLKKKTLNKNRHSRTQQTIRTMTRTKIENNNKTYELSRTYTPSRICKYVIYDIN